MFIERSGNMNYYAGDYSAAQICCNCNRHYEITPEAQAIIIACDGAYVCYACRKNIKTTQIEYATADLTGCTLITDTGITRNTTWRNAHASKKIITQVGSGSRRDREVTASWAIVTQCDSWMYTKAVNELQVEHVESYRVCTNMINRAWEVGSFELFQMAQVEIGNRKSITMYRVALRVQKIERAMTRVTSEPKSENRADESQYDGFVISRRERQEMTNNERDTMIDNEVAFNNWTFSRGILKRGFSGMKRQASIPTLATITRIDNEYAPVRARMIAEREWAISMYASVKHTPGIHVPARVEFMEVKLDVIAPVTRTRDKSVNFTRFMQSYID